MVEVSNRVLAALLVVAIVASLGGTFISLEKMKAIEFGPATGFATTDSGQVWLNVTTVAGLDFTDQFQYLNFKTGYVNTTLRGENGEYGKGNCTLYMNGTIKNKEFDDSPGCLGSLWVDSSWASDQYPLELTNAGTTYISVNLTSNESIATFFPVKAAGSTAVRSFQWMAVNNETSSCNETSSMITYFQNISTTEKKICKCLNSSPSKDSIAIGAKVRIPYDLQDTFYKHVNKIKWTAEALDKGTGSVC